LQGSGPDSHSTRPDAISSYMPAPISVVRVYPLLATGLGIKVGQALFSDGLVARFRVLSRDPPAVHLIGDEALPAHEQALVAWLAEQHRPTAA
jgi:hypothetical protein